MIKNKKLVLLILLISLLVTACSVDNPKESLEGPNDNKPVNYNLTATRTEFLMDTIMVVKMYGSEDPKILDAVFEMLEDMENRMSATIETSEVSQVNKNAGIKPVEVSDDTYYVLQEAKRFAEMSQGAYEPTIGPLVKLWEITSDLEDRDWIPEEEDIKDAMDLVNYEDLDLLEDNKVFLKRPGMMLDLGGIVKGFAADEVKRVLEEHGITSSIINLGGNIYAQGMKNGDDYWNIGLQDPLNNQGQGFGKIQVKNRSIVTSGDYERYFEIGDERYHHILDRTTGYPSNNELMGVTIVSDKSIHGDILSTAFFVLGIEKSLPLIEELGDVEVIFIEKDGSVSATDDIKSKLTINNSEFYKLKD